MTEDVRSGRPKDDDVIIWYLEERGGLDVYRVTKGATLIGEFTGRSIGSSVFHVALEHSEPGGVIWLKDELGIRALDGTVPVQRDSPKGRDD